MVLDPALHLIGITPPQAIEKRGVLKRGAHPRIAVGDRKIARAIEAQAEDLVRVEQGRAVGRADDGEVKSLVRGEIGPAVAGFDRPLDLMNEPLDTGEVFIGRPLAGQPPGKPVKLRVDQQHFLDIVEAEIDDAGAIVCVSACKIDPVMGVIGI